MQLAGQCPVCSSRERHSYQWRDRQCEGMKLQQSSIDLLFVFQSCQLLCIEYR